MTKKELKDLACKILEAKGIKHDEWLEQQYNELITQNAKLLIESLSLKKTFDE